jgi:hypothetical protein
MYYLLSHLAHCGRLQTDTVIRRETKFRFLCQACDRSLLLYLQPRSQSPVAATEVELSPAIGSEYPQSKEDLKEDPDGALPSDWSAFPGFFRERSQPEWLLYSSFSSWAGTNLQPAGFCPQFRIELATHLDPLATQLPPLATQLRPPILTTGVRVCVRYILILFGCK